MFFAGIPGTRPAREWRVAAAFLLIVPFLFHHVSIGSEQDRLDFANGLFHRGFHEEAIDEYERYLATGPTGEDAAVAWLRLGRCAVAISDFEKALDAFGRAAASTDDSARRLEALVSAGEALFFDGQYAAAIEALTGLVSPELPGEPGARAYYYLGRAHMETGATDAAIAALSGLTEAFSTSPLAAFAQYHLGFAHLVREDAEEAAKAFSVAANTEDADDALRMESRFRAAELYDKLGWTAAALGAYEQLRSEYPDSDYARRADYGYAWALYHSGRYDEAIGLADAFISQFPDSPHVAGLMYLKGNCLYQQRRHGDALAVYDALRERHPASGFVERALYKSAWAHHLSGDNSAAGQAVRAFLDCCPDSEFRGEGLYLLGILHVIEGDYEQALGLFQETAETYSESEFAADALFKSGECLAQLGLRGEAARTFEAFARAYPGNPLTEQAMLRSGDARFTAQDFAEALDNYKAILEAPSDPSVEEETMYRLAVTYHNMKARDKSAAAFGRLLERFPEGKYVLEAHFRIGEFELRHNQDTLKAIEAYQAALAGDPADSIKLGALQGLAMARYEQKDYEQATAQILQLIADYPEYPLPEDAYLWCAQWLESEERWADAAEVLAALLGAHPDHEERSEILFALGRNQEKTGETGPAIATYAAALEVGPDVSRETELRYRLGRMHEEQAAWDEAREFYETAANLDGGEISARARFHLAALDESQGNYDDAARNFMRLAILFVHETLSPEALWRAGNCYLQLNNSAQAATIFQELIDDYPDSPFAQQAQQKLDAPESGQEQTE